MRRIKPGRYFTTINGKKVDVFRIIDFQDGKELISWSYKIEGKSPVEGFITKKSAEQNARKQFKK